MNPTADRLSQTSSAARAQFSATDWARAIVTPLASLKLTVFLLVASVLLTWIATLDQATIDIWELKKKHFQNWLVFVPFQTFFVPAWFPNMQNVAGGFFVPSGITLIFAMLINLSAAHLLRFRLQASGTRLVAGVVMALVTGVLTWAIVFNGLASSGFQATPPIPYKTMWIVIQVVLLGLSIASLIFPSFMSADQKIEKWMLRSFGAIGICLLAVTLYLGEDAFIGDSAMRIMWQLTQSTLAAMVGLFATLLLFRRKAGIVLLHLGIAGLLVNEIYVTTTNREQEMMIEEGKSAAVAVDKRFAEMVIIDRTDPKVDAITTIPASRLIESQQSGEPIIHDDLPFNVQCLEFHVNTDYVNYKTGDNPATAGIGKEILLKDEAPIPGTVTDDRNYPGAYVLLTDKKTNQELGVYLLSLIAYENGYVDRIDRGEQTFHIGLRDKEIYKPYTVKLKDVKRKNYLGTDTPQWYGSEIVFEDEEKGISSNQTIWMNNPMRYGGETFYQHTYVPAFGGKGERTVLQVVKNSGWMIPYVCCMFVVVGLGYQFGTTLLSHLKKAQAKRVREDQLLPDLDQKKTGWQRFKPFVPAAIIVAIFGVWVTGQLSRAMRPPKVAEGEMRYDLLGQLPVTYEGRVKPLDSVARNLARQLCNREVVDYKPNVTKAKLFGLYRSNEKKPAIEWLVDTIFEKKGFDTDYEILRVEDPVVQRALKLPRRKSMDYTWAEILESRPLLEPMLNKILESDESTWSPFQKRITEVASKINKVNALKASLSSPDFWPENDIVSRLERAERFSRASNVPLAYPTGNDEEPWLSYTTAVNRNWLAGLAKEFGETNLVPLVRQINDREIVGQARIAMLQDEMKLQLIKEGKKKSEVDQMLKENNGLFPREVFTRLLLEVGPKINQTIEQRRQPIDQMLVKQIRSVMGDPQLNKVTFEESGFLEPLGSIEAAFRSGDAEALNKSTESYLASINEAQPFGLDPAVTKLESVYNGFSPFYLSMVMYLIGFIVSIVAWTGWGRTLSRAAFGLIAIGLLIQIGGIIARVMISGRPPVTNLYSSFTFVSAVAVFSFLFIERFTKLGLGNVMATVTGFLSLMAAWSISIRDGDTFTVLQAVLDTQFWLSTHVVCISLGYGATIVAGFLGIAYVLGGITSKVLLGDDGKRFGNVIYGVVCFGLLFSFFGTVLGGLWADDSWGRFWGWDPKENGALMIVLWNAVVLHARWAGLVKLRGVAVLAIIGNVITVWSWEAVNQLGIGLHTYGFTEGRMQYIVGFWVVNFAIAGIGLLPTKFWRSYDK